MKHPFEYEVSQAVHEDRLRGAAQQRLVAEATRSVAERRLPARVLRAAVACLRWPAVQARLVKPDAALTRGSV